MLQAEWIQTAAYRITDGLEVLSVKDYIEVIFHQGFDENSEKVSVSFGMSTGGVAAAKNWECARKYLHCEGQYLFLVANEGFYLPSIDRQNTSREIMCHRIIGRHILACALVDEIYSTHGQLFGLSTKSICFNHGFVRPIWLSTEKLVKRLSQFLGKVGGIETLDPDEYRAVRRYLGIAPPGLE